MSKKTIAPGQMYGKLKVIDKVNKKGRERYWICECQCEDKTIKEVRSDHLLRGETTSCGCFQKERASEVNKNNYIDITGQKFGHLTVLEKTDKKKNKLVVWKCQCDCENKTIVYRTLHQLQCNPYTCFCDKCNAGKLGLGKDLTGKRFGHLTAIKPVGRGRDQRVIWECQCDCENKTIVYASSNSLLSNKKNSCGCIISQGEEKIKNVLKNELKIDFIQQKTFDDCINPKTNRKLRFDFYIPKYNCCLEYDGKQHHVTNAHGIWYTEEELLDIKYRDKIKTNYCKENGIFLIRIPYTDFKKINKEYIKNLLFQIDRGE